MSATPTVVSTTSNYQVKSIEAVMVGSGDVRARLFILAPGDTISMALSQRVGATTISY